MDAAASPTNEITRARPRRRWFRYSLRTLLALVTLAVGLGVVVHRAERQRRAVAAIEASGGGVRYEYEDVLPGSVAEFPGPDWLSRLLGVDYFDDVTYAYLGAEAGNAELAEVSALTRLRELWLDDTQVTDTGCERLQRSLPDCVICR